MIHSKRQNAPPPTCDRLIENINTGSSIENICKKIASHYVPFSNRKLNSDYNSPAIPANIHHVWFTNTQKVREIRDSDVENIFNTHTALVNSVTNWHHVVWTNNKSLIPESVSRLEKKGVSVIEITELQDCQLCDEILHNIERLHWGIASDIARLEILREHGGIYTDVNYVLNGMPLQEMSTYNFFAQSRDGIYIGNYFIASTAGNKILKEWLNIIEQNLGENPPFYIKNILETHDTREITIATTALPSCLAFICAGDKDAVVFTESECTSEQEDCLGSDPVGLGAESWL